MFPCRDFIFKARARAESAESHSHPQHTHATCSSPCPHIKGLMLPSRRARAPLVPIQHASTFLAVILATRRERNRPEQQRGRGECDVEEEGRLRHTDAASTDIQGPIDQRANHLEPCRREIGGKQQHAFRELVRQQRGTARRTALVRPNCAHAMRFALSPLSCPCGIPSFAPSAVILSQEGEGNTVSSQQRQPTPEDRIVLVDALLDSHRRGSESACRAEDADGGACKGDLQQAGRWRGGQARRKAGSEVAWLHVAIFKWFHVWFWF